MQEAHGVWIRTEITAISQPPSPMWNCQGRFSCQQTAIVHYTVENTVELEGLPQHITCIHYIVVVLTAVRFNTDVLWCGCLDVSFSVWHTTFPHFDTNCEANISCLTMLWGEHAPCMPCSRKIMAVLLVGNLFKSQCSLHVQNCGSQ